MSDWLQKAISDAERHPTVSGLRSRAAWHRQQSENFLNNSVASMRQHEIEAECLEANAAYLKMDLVAKAGMLAGEWRSYCTGHNSVVGRYIQIETDQGWNPDYFWCEGPVSCHPTVGGL